MFDAQKEVLNIVAGIMFLREYSIFLGTFQHFSLLDHFTLLKHFNIFINKKILYIFSLKSIRKR